MTGERFTVIYHIQGDEASALQKAKTICLEQTVEVGDELVPDGFIRDQVIGQIEQFTLITTDIYEATISYAIETTAFELTQLLNVMFGNTSIKTGIKVHRFNLSENLAARFSGPQFGLSGLRQKVGVYEQPLLCAVLKPMGQSPTELAQLAYYFALAGVDLIKDDHGLTNQPFCPYQTRIKACIEAIAKANQETGKHCLYVPNITAPVSEIWDRARLAQSEGAGGGLIAPGLIGFDMMRALAEDETIDFPLISHPALLGSFVTSPHNGFSHASLFGQLQRLAGADATIYPNYGGRFGFSRQECQWIAESCREEMGHYLPIFPTPGGGMTRDRILDMLALYGHDVMFLIGGALLHSQSDDFVAHIRHFLSLMGR